MTFLKSLKNTRKISDFIRGINILMATINIKISSEGKILIEPEGDISPQDWSSVVSWWDREFNFLTAKK